MTRLFRADGEGGFYFRRRRTYKDERAAWRRARCVADQVGPDSERYGVGRTAAFPAIVTAPIRASALPFSVAPVFRLID